jgi:hypothetical protein
MADVNAHFRNESNEEIALFRDTHKKNTCLIAEAGVLIYV